MIAERRPLSPVRRRYIVVQTHWDIPEADRLAADLPAVLAHELRSPLCRALVASDLIISTDADDATKAQAAQLIRRQLRHMSHLVDEVLDVTKIALGKITVRCLPLDLTTWAPAAAANLRAPLDEAGVSLAVEVPDESVWVRADDTRLMQVLANLLGNAAKFTDRGGRVVVSVAADADGRRALLAVHDTGAGIEPHMLREVFELFTQAEQTRHCTGSGLGLGLALVKALVELQGGEVEARSEGPGQGSEFIISLPLDDVAPPPSGPRKQALCLFSSRNLRR
jgi:signal transduction histidine kinase